MKSSPTKKLITLGGEAALAIALCLVSYGLFLHVLGMIFPSNGGLRDLLNSSASVTPDTQGSGLTADVEEAPARLTIVNPNVTHKRADGVAWTQAKSGIDLHGRDGVQTAKHGTATIDFGDQNLLHMGENTLIIIRESMREPDRNAHQASVFMMEGRMWADVDSAAGGTMALHVETPGGSARLGSQGGKTAKVRVMVGKERGSTFSVVAGSAEIQTKRGTLNVGANQFVEVDSSGSTSVVRQLPPPPALELPSTGASAPAGDATAFSWSPADRATGYHFVLARDADFRDVVVDAMTQERTHRCERLKPGAYYWRVSTLLGNAEGSPGPARSVQLTKSGEGPRLVVNLPPPVVHGSRFHVKGTTDHGAEVWISDTAVDVDAQGRFGHDVALKPGVNVVVVEAVDPEGNSTYRSRIVNSKP